MFVVCRGGRAANLANTPPYILYVAGYFSRTKSSKREMNCVEERGICMTLEFCVNLYCVWSDCDRSGGHLLYSTDCWKLICFCQCD